MVYLLFFYDMAITMASLALCVVFAVLFARGGNPLHLWLSVLFGSCTVDIALMYLLDFVPEFQLAFGVAEIGDPLAYVYVHFLILFCCRWVAGLVFRRPPQLREGALWVFLAAVTAVAALLAPGRVASSVENVCLGVIQVYLVALAVRGMRTGADGGVLDRRWLWALIAAFAACALGYFVYAMLADGAGLVSPRNPFVDLSGGAYLVFACAYLVAYRRQGQRATLDDVVRLASGRYDLTRREGEILLMLAEGKSNQEIGSALFISVGTVKTHVHNIYVKLGINKRADLRPVLENCIAGTPQAVCLGKR